MWRFLPHFRPLLKGIDGNEGNMVQLGYSLQGRLFLEQLGMFVAKLPA